MLRFLLVSTLLLASACTPQRGIESESPASPADGLGCLAGFIRADSDLANEIRRLAAPVVCRRSEQLEVAAFSETTGSTFEEKAGASLMILAVRATGRTSLDARAYLELLLKTRMPEGLDIREIAGLPSGSADGRPMRTAGLTILASGNGLTAAIVCVAGTIAPTSGMGTTICRVTDDVSISAQVQLARRIIEADLPSVIW